MGKDYIIELTPPTAEEIRACSHYLRDSMMKDHVQFLEARKDATKAFQASKRSTWLRLL